MTLHAFVQASYLNAQEQMLSMFSITESLLVASPHVTFYFPPKCILLFMLIIYRHLEKPV